MKLFDELKRRKVFRVGIAYVAVSWLLVQVAETLLPAYGFDDAAMRSLVAVLAVGFVIVLLLAWVFEWTPAGVVKTPDADEAGARGNNVPATRAPNTVIAIIILIATSVAAYLTFFTVDDDRYSDNSIAVLPFTTLGEDEADVFTDGMHVGVLTRLSDVVDLDVISRTSALQYRQNEERLPVIAAELGAAWIMRGDVQQAGQRVLVSVSLTDAINDRQVWAEDYQRTLTTENIFDIQAEISLRIINELRARLTEEEQGRIGAAPTDNLAAYRQYQEGRYLLETRQPDAMRTAVGHFEAALELDPNYALAWTGIASALANLYSYRHDTDRATLERAIAASDKALELNHELAEAWAARAITLYVLRDLPEAIRSAERAIELRPNFAQAYVYKAYYSSLSGRLDVAYESAGKALSLDPMNIEAIANFVVPAQKAGEHEAALTEARRGRSLAPGWDNTKLILGEVLFQTGRYDEAAALLDGVNIPWVGMGAATIRVMSLFKLGRELEAKDLAEEILRSEDQFSRATILAATGQREEAWAILESFETWEDWPTFGVRNAYLEVWNPGGNDPRHAAIIRAVNKSWGVE